MKEPAYGATDVGRVRKNNGVATHIGSKGEESMSAGTSLDSGSELAGEFFRLTVELLSGPMDGLEFEIAKQTATVGREEMNDVPLALDGLVSRQHARISFENGEYWLEDLGSRNGTFVEEKQVKGKVRLPLGAIFRVGGCEMRLR
jgi:pSer/pThr/pTyr-binding forkhead associated (FHA) protein